MTGVIVYAPLIALYFVNTQLNEVNRLI